MKKPILSAAGIAVAAALTFAPAMTALADEAPVEETAPITTPVDEVTPAEEEVVVDETPVAPEVTEPVEEAPVEVAPEVPAPVVETAPVAPTPQTKTLRWTLPNGGTPDNVTWDQPVFNAGAVPCGTTVWVQVDTYPYTTPEDQARTDALDDDGVLRFGEDHGWAQSWTFEQYVAPACAPSIVEIPYPTLLADELCGPDNDTVYVDPAWLEQYGHLIAGPWIDTKYKTIDGKRVVDGSAQIKAEYRKTHIWAGTAGTTASDFRRWMMYPGTAPFTHQDVATDCPVIEEPPVDEPEVPEVPTEPETPATPEQPAAPAEPVSIAAAVTPATEASDDTLATTGGTVDPALLIGGTALTILGVGTLLYRRRRSI